MEKKQSSTDWLFCQLIDKEYKNPHDMELISIIQQAKAMRIEEIIDAYWLGYGDGQNMDSHNMDEILEYVLK